jgi:arginyl-tRNA synthetase
LKVDETRASLNRIIEQVEQTLGEQSVDAKRLRVLKVEATEYGELRAKFAFLVTKSEFDAFRDAAEQLAQEHQSAGVRLELTGPWPPYNFTRIE